MKKLIYLLIAISLIISLAACGKEEAQSSSEQGTESEINSATSEESSLAEETSEESAVSEEKVVLGKQPLYDITEGGVYPSPSVTITSVRGKVTLNNYTFADFNTKKANRIKSFYDFVCQPFAIGTVETPKELSCYGLDGQESAAAEINAFGRKDRYLRIGNSFKGIGYFALLGEKDEDSGEKVYGDTVYILGDIAGCAFEEPLYFATEYYGVGDMGAHYYYTYIDWFKIITEDESYEFYPISNSEKGEFHIDESWKLTAPERLFRNGKSYENVNNMNVTDMLYAIGTLKCDNIAVEKPTEEDIADYGLDKPYRSYSYRTAGDTYTVHITKPDGEGKFYVYGTEDYQDGCCLGTNVFSIGLMESPFGFMEYTDYNLVIDTLFLKPLSYVKSIEVSSEDGVHTIDISGMTDRGYPIATLDGGDVACLSGNLETWYNILRMIEIEYQYREIPPEASTMRIVLNCEDETISYSFYVLDGENVHCSVNGEEHYLISRSDYDWFADRYKLLLAGEEILDFAF